MTRAEFAKRLDEWLEKTNNKKKEETLAEFVERSYWPPNWKMIADIATNGFDPDPIIADKQVLSRVTEQLNDAAKRSRPFVGSHNLPHDTDWD